MADPTCTRVLLADQTFTDSVAIGRTLDVLGVAGGSSTVRGTIAVADGAVVGLSDLIVSGCSEARVSATGGGRVVGVEPAGLDLVFRSLSPDLLRRLRVGRRELVVVLGALSSVLREV